MIAYEVSLNGKKACLAGVGDSGVLSAITSWVKRTTPDGQTEVELDLSVTGLIGAGPHDNEHLHWLNQSLSVGDQVCIRVVEASEVDSPARRERIDPAFAEQAERRYYEHLKKRYEPAE